MDRYVFKDMANSEYGTEIDINVRPDDGITNGASNIIKKIALHDKRKPSGVVWVQFYHADVGEKTRQD